MKERLPLLARTARMIFAIQASSAASERVFSLGNKTKTPRRPLLSSKKLEDLCIIKLNYRRIEEYIAGKDIESLKMPEDYEIEVELPLDREELENSEEESSDDETEDEED